MNICYTMGSYLKSRIKHEGSPGASEFLFVSFSLQTPRGLPPYCHLGSSISLPLPVIITPA